MEAVIESLTHDGRGLTHVDGKAVFVFGALPGERVMMRLTSRQRRYDEASVVEVLEASPQRVAPRCESFGRCGGCSLQHLEPEAQIAAKQEILGDVLRRIGGLAPERWLPPLTGAHWGYRRKARLGVRWVEKKGRVLVGFRERGSAFICDSARCEVLLPEVGDRLEDLAQLIQGLSIRSRVAQIEVAQGDGPIVLVFRALDPPSDADLERLAMFGEQHGLQIQLQPGGVDSIQPLPGQTAVDLSYGLENGLRLHFRPSDFTQVNLGLNRAMIAQALDLLAAEPDESVLDLFCGLGNFTLPIARRAARVVGVEGDAGLVARAEDNARRNGIDNARFYQADLYAEDPLTLEGQPWRRERFDKALIDPPRSGALQVLDLLAETGVRQLVYVSCYPSTLARDAEQLVSRLGFRLVAAGAMDMFPHTAHLESMALFTRD